jgi:hypothetical protein
MKYIVFLFWLQIALSFTTLAQDKSLCWQITAEKSEKYIEGLFRHHTGHSPDFALIKVDFDGGVFGMIGIQQLQSYCKMKFNLADSSRKSFTKQFVLEGKKVLLADTSWFKNLDPYFRVFQDTVLDRYRSIGARDFMVKNCEGNVLKVGSYAWVLAYLYESRIFWDNMTDRISSFTLREFEQSCKIKWNPKKKRWIDLRTGKIARIQ